MLYRDTRKIYPLENHSRRTGPENITMAGDKLPSVQSLEKPEDLNGLLRQDRGDDCLPCRVIGRSLPFSSLPFHSLSWSAW